ncbi:hypothetical protein ACFL6U_12585 [Planctomycetota bacterium]
MATIDTLISLLDERAIAQQITIPHDELRMRYPLHANTVEDFNEFRELITDYFSYHHSNSFTQGGRWSSNDAYNEVVTLLEQQYRRKGGTLTSIYHDAHSGLNGGVRIIIDNIAEALKEKAVENYINGVFDRLVAPVSYEPKVEIIRQFMAWADDVLPDDVRTERPERYAKEYKGLIRGFIQGLQQTSSVFRRF